MRWCWLLLAAPWPRRLLLLGPLLDHALPVGVGLARPQGMLAADGRPCPLTKLGGADQQPVHILPGTAQLALRLQAVQLLSHLTVAVLKAPRVAVRQLHLLAAAVPGAADHVAAADTAVQVEPELLLPILVLLLLQLSQLGQRLLQVGAGVGCVPGQHLLAQGHPALIAVIQTAEEGAQVLACSDL